MRDTILYEQTSPLLKITLDSGEAISAISYALVGMSSAIQLETKIRPGLKSYTGGQDSTVFMHTFRARGGEGEVLLAPRFIGEIFKLNLDEAYLIQPGAYLASSEGVNLDTKWGGGGALSNSEGLRLLRCSGRFSDLLFLSTYGALHKFTLEQSQSYEVDPGNLVGIGESVRFRLRQLGGVKPSMANLDANVVELQGPGMVLMQSRNPDLFLRWIIDKLND